MHPRRASLRTRRTSPRPTPTNRPDDQFENSQPNPKNIIGPLTEVVIDVLSRTVPGIQPCQPRPTNKNRAKESCPNTFFRPPPQCRLASIRLSPRICCIRPSMSLDRFSRPGSTGSRRNKSTMRAHRRDLGYTLPASPIFTITRRPPSNAGQMHCIEFLTRLTAELRHQLLPRFAAPDRGTPGFV